MAPTNVILVSWVLLKIKYYFGKHFRNKVVKARIHVRESRLWQGFMSRSPGSGAPGLMSVVPGFGQDSCQKVPALARIMVSESRLCRDSCTAQIGSYKDK